MTRKRQDKSLPGSPAKRLLQTWVTRESHAALGRIAAVAGLKSATYLRLLVERHVAQVKSGVDLPAVTRTAPMEQLGTHRATGKPRTS